MAGTIEGGKKAAAKNIAKNPNFYSDIGRKGGQNGHTGGFASNPELARIAGAKGGRISKRGPAKKLKEKPLVETIKKRRWNRVPFNAFRTWRD